MSTTKLGEALAFRVGKWKVLVCVRPESPEAADLCVYPRGGIEASAGDEGTLTFTDGGPTGGYWLFARDADPGRAGREGGRG